jgi:hypothetical protein
MAGDGIEDKEHSLDGWYSSPPRGGIWGISPLGGVDGDREGSATSDGEGSGSASRSTGSASAAMAAQRADDGLPREGEQVGERRARVWELATGVEGRGGRGKWESGDWGGHWLG